MSATYAILWKSKVNGRAGKSTRLFDREEAERLAEELNREYPEIHHEAVHTGNAGEPLDAQSETEGPTSPEESPDAQPSFSPVPVFELE